MQVLTSAVSAEYGRFGGGVVNMITRSGEQRAVRRVPRQLSNPRGARRHRSKNPQALRGPASCRRPSRRRRADRRAAIASGSSAVRASNEPRRRARLRRRGIPFTTSNENTRYEGKLTATLRPGHTLQGTLIDNRTDLQPAVAERQHRSRDVHHAVDAQSDCRRRTGGACWCAHVCRSAVSRRRPGSSRTPAAPAPRSSTHRFSPAACRASRPICSTTARTSTRPIPRSATIGSSRPACRTCSRRGALGTHEVKCGFEYFTSTRVGGNSQT